MNLAIVVHASSKTHLGCYMRKIRVTDDVSKVTCKRCLDRIETGRKLVALDAAQGGT